MHKQTEDLLITEKHLLLPMIWEGDLNIHSNEPFMKTSSFQNIILHGDTVFSLAIALVEKQERPFTFLYEYKNAYKRSVTIGDKTFVEYTITQSGEQNTLHFSVFKNERELVMEGSLVFAQEKEGC